MRKPGNSPHLLVRLRLWVLFDEACSVVRAGLGPLGWAEARA
jgi:hypothetical protein